MPGFRPLAYVVTSDLETRWPPERQEALASARDFIVVQTEGSLRWHITSPEVMAAQMEALVVSSERPNLRLGVIPWTVPVRGAALHGFQIFDSRAVILGTEAATAIITDPKDVSPTRSGSPGTSA